MTEEVIDRNSLWDEVVTNYLVQLDSEQFFDGAQKDYHEYFSRANTLWLKLQEAGYFD